MRTKHIYVFIHIRIKGEVRIMKLFLVPTSNVLTDRSKAVLPLWFLLVLGDDALIS